MVVVLGLLAITFVGGCERGSQPDGEEKKKEQKEWVTQANNNLILLCGEWDLDCKNIKSEKSPSVNFNIVLIQLKEKFLKVGIDKKKLQKFEKLYVRIPPFFRIKYKISSKYVVTCVKLTEGIFDSSLIPPTYKISQRDCVEYFKKVIKQFPDRIRQNIDEEIDCENFADRFRSSIEDYINSGSLLTNIEKLKKLQEKEKEVDSDVIKEVIEILKSINKVFSDTNIRQ